MRLSSERRSTQAAARNPQVRALRAATKQLAQELDILKKALVIFSQSPPCALTATVPNGPARYRFASGGQALHVAPAACYAWPRRQQVSLSAPT